mmetsp:Transcript_47803/g.104059  ORF Transcript_47803/g.104059 Transcript_47803/m.104059 type:complete len:234 (+) Transcript_47803:51-752(+)
MAHLHAAYRFITSEVASPPTGDLSEPILYSVPDGDIAEFVYAVRISIFSQNREKQESMKELLKSEHPASWVAPQRQEAGASLLHGREELLRAALRAIDLEDMVMQLHPAMEWLHGVVLLLVRVMETLHHQADYFDVPHGMVGRKAQLQPKSPSSFPLEGHLQRLGTAHHKAHFALADTIDHHEGQSLGISSNIIHLHYSISDLNLSVGEVFHRVVISRDDTLSDAQDEKVPVI